jgi:hypothetical protein
MKPIIKAKRSSDRNSFQEECFGLTDVVLASDWI